MFDEPMNVWEDSAGRLYVADQNSHRIRMVHQGQVADTQSCRIRKISGGQVTTIAGTGVCASVDGPVGTAQLNTPVGLAFDSAGVIYFVEYQGHRLRKIDNGQVVTLAGSGALSFLDGPLLAARLSSPRGLALDPAGRLFVADSFSHSVRMIADDQATTLAGTGKEGFMDGPAAQSQFRYPRHVLPSTSGVLYVADRHNHRIRIVTP